MKINKKNTAWAYELTKSEREALEKVLNLLDEVIYDSALFDDAFSTDFEEIWGVLDELLCCEIDDNDYPT